MGPGRLHALIDGIFAIAITLLVLDLPKPEDPEHLAADLLHAWPSYAAYLVSFATVGVLWIEHHGMMSAVRRIDRRFLERSLLLLLFVTTIPWPTQLAAASFDTGPQARPAAVLYAATMLGLGLSFAWSWRYLVIHPDLVSEPARPALRAGFTRALLGSLPYAAAVAVAFVSPQASFAIDALVVVYFAVSRSSVPGLIAGSSST